MLVRIRPGAELTGAEREFVECLRAYPSTGLALIDCRVGDRRLGAVIVTPRGITVVEVKGFRRRQSGLLGLGRSGAWTISDSPLDLDTEPSSGLTDRVEHGVHAVRVALERALQDSRHVCGAVVLVPYRGVVVRPARTALRPGLDVLIANTVDAHELRVYLENFSAGPRDWTVERVRNACTAFGLADLAPSRAELGADGFAPNRPAPAPPPVRRFVEPVKAPPVEPSARGKLAGLVVFAVALLGVLIVFVVVVLALLRESPTPSRTVSETTQSTTRAPAQTGPRAPAQSTTHAPAQAGQQPPQCWPFQDGC
ncbi:NERD domain-containing protein [Nocardia halotolerans]|uniref:NERD domain-containing protein n=1 Tax=Nocardia halotolerans TaxID=1755878 RepID=A0ABV8VMX9_9NOCA